MAIKINKDFPVGLTQQTVSHWLVTKVAHRHNQKKVIIEMIGFFNNSARNEGNHPVGNAFERHHVKNETIPILDESGAPVLDENGEPTFETNNKYNKWINFKIDRLTLVDGVISDGDTIIARNSNFIRDKHVEKAKVLEFMTTVPGFDGLETED